MRPTATSNYVPRHAEGLLLEALGDTRVVLINGARQSGKSTLARRVGRSVDAAWYSLDDAPTRRLAADDPTGFVRLEDRMVIDEIQRDPELLLSIKSLVDELPTPGRFLLTGSARVMGLRHLPDTLVGRMETIELWPLSQGEIDQTPDHFVDVAFQLGPDLRHHSAETRDSYIERIVRGGFPAVIGRPERRRIDYLSNYVADLINRDVMELSEIERRPELRRLVTVLAGRSAQPITVDRLGSEVGLSGKTTSRYLALLEETYLIKRIPAWTRRLGARSLAQDKLAFVDSGIAAAMLGQTPARLRKPGAPLGPLLEAFVAMELARQLTWSVERAELTHYRTKDGVEVDLVLENRRGEVIGIEVKASATPSPGDFAGLRHLERRLGPDFLAGYVLHTGTDTLPAGPKMCAVPLSAIWLTQSS